LFTLWSMVQSYSHSILNECYTELLPTSTSSGIRLMPSVVLRPIPFTRKKPGEVTGLKQSEDEKQFEQKYGEKAKGRNLPTLRIQDSQVRSQAGADLEYGFYTSKIIQEDEIGGINYGKSDSERFNFFF